MRCHLIVNLPKSARQLYGLSSSYCFALSLRLGWSLGFVVSAMLRGMLTLVNVGDRLGHDDVPVFIGEGGRGAVYTATDSRLDRPGIRAVCCWLVAIALLTAPVRAQQTPVQVVPSVQPQTVWVMPFTNTSRVDADQWIGAGIAETLASDLLRTPGIEVLDLGGLTQEVKGEASLGVEEPDDLSALRIGRARGATWVIAGGYQHVGDRLRITARLLDVTTGGMRHSVRVDGTIDELFMLQDQVVEAIGAALGPSGGTRVAGAAPPVPAPIAQPDLPPSHTASPPSATPPPVLTSAPGLAGATTPASVEEMPPLVLDGPPPPLPPATITRDVAGRVTVRAVRLPEGLTVDGALDEEAYETVPAFSDFIQTEPQMGEPASEKTEGWVFFDDANIYVVARCWDSAPESEWVVNEMRRDNGAIINNQQIVFFLDTFYTRRNAAIFNINPIGGRMDGQITNETTYNGDWNPVWDLKTGRFAGGWTFEAAIPFKSLRYRPGRTQVWGFQMHRTIRRKNELVYLTRLERDLGNRAVFLMSRGATLVGLEVPAGGRLLEIKPYLIGDVNSDVHTSPIVSNAFGGNVGLDVVKYGVTQNLTADFTVNPDFAQVEADEQQVNLTRFSLFFPEKREFFLENQGVFAFGGGGTRGGGLTPILFYSRQIGLSQGREVPIDGGGRLTGRVGAFNLGVLNIQAGNDPEAGAVATNFSAIRLKRDVLRRSSIGALFTRRSVSTRGPGANETYGLDGTFAFFDNLSINTYWAQTRTSGLASDDDSYRAQLNYEGDRYGVQVDRLVVGDDFNPEVGFLRRDDFERSFGSFRFSPRLLSSTAIRKLSWEGRVDYISDRAGVLETREAQGQFGIEFENSDRFAATYTRSYEFLEQPFPIASDVTIPVGGYGFQDVGLSFMLGQQRRLSGTFSAQHGSFFSGDKTTVGFNQGRLELTPQFSVQPSYSYNQVDLPEGRFTTQLVRTRTTYTVTPLMFVSALVQYNSSSDSLSTNLRLRWEYSPGSELFVVYNENRDTDPLVPDRFSELRNRAFVVKINRLFRF